MINKKIILSCILISLLLSASVCIHLYQKRDSNKNIILIVIETLRADHLSCYNYHRETSKNLDKLAKEGILFKRCFVQAPWTIPSLSSIFTSLYPSSHGNNMPGGRLSTKAKALAEILKENYFTTQAFDAAGWARSEYGFSQGFDNYNEDSSIGNEKVSSFRLTDDAVRWIKLNRKNKFFLFLFYNDTHYMYTYHRGISFYKEKSKNVYSDMKFEKICEIKDSLDEEDIKTLTGYYDGEIKLVDQSLGRLFNEMRKLGVYNNTIIIVTGDHGEEFGAHGYFGHTYTIYNDVLHVPLIIKVPGNKIKNIAVEEVVSSIDIMPTVLNLLRIKNNYNFQGTDISRFFRDVKYPAGNKISIAETWNRWPRKSIQTKEWKMTFNDINGTTYYELFNLADDPREMNNLAESYKEKLAEFKQIMSSKIEAIQKIKLEEEKSELTEAESSEMRSLGYLN